MGRICKKVRVKLLLKPELCPALGLTDLSAQASEQLLRVKFLFLESSLIFHSVVGALKLSGSSRAEARKHTASTSAGNTCFPSLVRWHRMLGPVSEFCTTPSNTRHDERETLED